MGIKCMPARYANQLREVRNMLTGLMMRHMQGQRNPEFRE